MTTFIDPNTIPDSQVREALGVITDVAFNMACTLRALEVYGTVAYMVAQEDDEHASMQAVAQVVNMVNTLRHNPLTGGPGPLTENAVFALDHEAVTEYLEAVLDAANGGVGDGVTEDDIEALIQELADADGREP